MAAVRDQSRDELQEELPNHQNLGTSKQTGQILAGETPAAVCGLEQLRLKLQTRGTLPQGLVQGRRQTGEEGGQWDPPLGHEHHTLTLGLPNPAETGPNAR